MAESNLPANQTSGQPAGNPAPADATTLDGAPAGATAPQDAQAGGLKLADPSTVSDPIRRQSLEAMHRNGLDPASAPAWAVTGQSPDLTTAGDQTERIAAEAMATPTEGDSADAIYSALTSETTGFGQLLDDYNAQAAADLAAEASLTAQETRQIVLEERHGHTAESGFRNLVERLGSEAEANRAIANAQKTLREHPRLKEVLNYDEENNGGKLANSPSLVLALAD